MGVENLDKFFYPGSVAVIGADRRPQGVGTIILGNLISGGFKGSIYPVNPKYDSLIDRPCYPDLDALPEPVDLVAVAAPFASTPDIIKDCARLGVKAVLAVSGKGRENDMEQAKIAEDVRTAALSSGVRLLGPRSMGVVSTSVQLNASLVGRTPLPGGLAFISQSGGILSAISDWAREEKIGFSHLISLGAGVDAGFGDLMDYLGLDAGVKAILLYVESLGNVRKFMSAARAVSRVKPIVVLKAGRCPAQGAAWVPTPNDDRIYDQVFKRSGIVRVRSVQELFDCAELMAGRPQPKGPRLAIVSNFGGPAVMASDELKALGGEPAILSEQTMARLDEFLPDSWNRANPVDILGDADAERYLRTVDVLSSDPEIDGLVVINCPRAVTDPVEIASTLAGYSGASRRSMFMVWMGGEAAAAGRRIFRESGTPAYESPERAVRAFWYMQGRQQNLRLLQEIPRRFSRTLKFDQKEAAALIRNVIRDGRENMTSAEARSLLGYYGFPVKAASVSGRESAGNDPASPNGRTGAAAVPAPPAAERFSDPEGDGRLGRAFGQIVFSAEKRAPATPPPEPVTPDAGVRPDLELRMGARKDARFGPVLYFGLGGRCAEAAADPAFGLPPLNRLLAERMLEGSRVLPLLKAYSRNTGFELSELEELLARLSRLTADFPQITDIEINPLSLIDGEVQVGEACATVAPSEAPAPLHLVISPYPDQYEMTTSTRGGVNINIRPIRPEDAPLLIDLFSTLSDRSIYLRFCQAVKTLSPETLAKFTQVDYDREIALIALDADAPAEKMLGVARAIYSPDEKNAELAVVVGDPWQGRGVGACLFQRCMEIAMEKGRTRLFAYILPENRVMRSMALKMGWKSAQTEEGEYLYQTVEGGGGDTPPPQ